MLSFCEDMILKSQTKKVTVHSGDTVFLEYNTVDARWHWNAEATVDAITLVGAAQPSWP